MDGWRDFVRLQASPPVACEVRSLAVKKALHCCCLSLCAAADHRWLV